MGPTICYGQLFESIAHCNLFLALYVFGFCCHKFYHIISYRAVDLKRQNHLKVGTDKPKLKVKMQSVSDDDVQKRLFISKVVFIVFVM